MTNLQRRLKNLEARLFTDQSGLVPHSPAWLGYWKQQAHLYATDQLPRGYLFPLEAIRAVIRNMDDSDFDLGMASDNDY